MRVDGKRDRGGEKKRVGVGIRKLWMMKGEDDERKKGIT